jgi:hypothetical protein
MTAPGAALKESPDLAELSARSVDPELSSAVASSRARGPRRSTGSVRPAGSPDQTPARRRCPPRARRRAVRSACRAAYHSRVRFCSSERQTRMDPTQPPAARITALIGAALIFVCLVCSACGAATSASNGPTATAQATITNTPTGPAKPRQRIGNRCGY